MKKLSPLLVLLLLTACGGGSSDSTPIITVPPFTPAPTPAPTPPVVAPVGPALFSAPQKIEGIQIAIPYTEVDYTWTMEFTLGAFYLIDNRLSVLKTFLPLNTTKPDVYGEEFAYNLTNNSSTVYATKANSLVSTSNPEDMIEIADFNHDGFKDIFIGDSGYDAGATRVGGQNKLLFGSASGLVDKSSNIPAVKDFTHSTAISDIDSDGDIDIYVGNTTSFPAPYFLVNDGSSRFTRRDDLFTAGFNASVYTASEFADLDSDGVPELVLGGDSALGGANSIILRYANGKYGVSKTLETAGRIVTDITIADLNGDGKKEIVMSSTAAEPFYKGTTIFVYGQTNGEYARTEAFVISEQRWNSKLFVTDVNRDGLLDIVSTGLSTPDTKILINNGKTFKVDESFKAPWDPVWTGVEMWDINNDGKLDFIFTKQEQQITPKTLNVGVYVMFGR